MTKGKVKVICDGSVYGTKVVTPSGDEIVAMNVRFSHNGGEIPIVTLDLIGVEFEGVLPIGPSVKPPDTPFKRA